MFEQKNKNCDISLWSDAEKISLQINNLIETYGIETIKETLTLFNFQYKVKTKDKKEGEQK